MRCSPLIQCSPHPALCRAHGWKGPLAPWMVGCAAGAVLGGDGAMAAAVG